MLIQTFFFLSFPGTGINFYRRGLLNAFKLSNLAKKLVLFIYSRVKHILSSVPNFVSYESSSVLRSCVFNLLVPSFSKQS